MRSFAPLSLLTFLLTLVSALPHPSTTTTPSHYVTLAHNITLPFLTLSPRSEDQILCYSDYPQLSLVDTQIWWLFYLIADLDTQHTLNFGECVEQSYEGVISYMCGGDPNGPSTYATDDWARRYEEVYNYCYYTDGKRLGGRMGTGEGVVVYFDAK